MIADQRKEELRKEFAYYLGENLEDFDYTEVDDFMEEYEVDEEEMDYLRGCSYEVVVEES